jgi:hypothetical protein
MKRFKYFLKKIIIAHQKNVLGEKLKLFATNKIKQYFLIPMIFFFIKAEDK